MSTKDLVVSPIFAPIVLVLCLACPSQLAGQAPFYTDDVGVAEKGHLHLEVNNEYDRLQSSAAPNLRQNTANLKVSYGLISNLEVGFDNQLITIFNGATPFLPEIAFGYGDLDLSVKWNFRNQHEIDGWPALAASLNIELPNWELTEATWLGYYGLLPEWNRAKIPHGESQGANHGGVYFAGNTLTGAVGIRNTRGVVFTGGTSLVRDFTPRLDLGLEVYGAVSHNFDLGRGQLQTQLGRNYKLRRNVSPD